MLGNKVLVMLSTYNGARYLDEQMESLLKQENVNLNVLIRDDGSSDETVSIIDQYIESNPSRISMIHGENVGVVRSFFELVTSAPLEYDYYAFCDQDDVWEKHKLSRALDMLQDLQVGPNLYCSSTKMVDEQLTFIKKWPEKPERPLSVSNSLIENVCVGCTMVMNREAFQLIKEYPPVHMDQIIMHDWWVYLCISAFGHVFFDDKSAILYRQHGANVLGGATGGFVGKWTKRFKRFMNGDNYYILSKQAREFLCTFQSRLNDKHVSQIQMFLKRLEGNLFSRMVYVLNSPFYRQSRIDNLVYKVVYTAGKI
ncbi:glycosyltransferase family 2 protein [Paenibacillus sp. USDA918EY]|uniref:glycosyltransferase family 2 protein n=1 Tax=Paenibacillus sp. USDA918EY TaxID=2689575 RepID=UPI0013591842|nr:glycosyltransferase family 2 protein [Paenibacillus sp. USDA918EY]